MGSIMLFNVIASKQERNGTFVVMCLYIQDWIAQIFQFLPEHFEPLMNTFINIFSSLLADGHYERIPEQCCVRQSDMYQLLE